MSFFFMSCQDGFAAELGAIAFWVAADIGLEGRFEMFASCDVSFDRGSEIGVGRY
jgi:hypothetical protein